MKSRNGLVLGLVCAAAFGLGLGVRAQDPPAAAATLSKAQIEQAEAWIAQKAPKAANCAACGGKVGVNPYIFTMLGWSPNNIITDVTSPVVVVSCPGCGHMDLFSTKMMGITK